MQKGDSVVIQNLENNAAVFNDKKGKIVGKNKQGEFIVVVEKEHKFLPGAALELTENNLRLTTKLEKALH